jgi:putative Mn2+ efflux pump MntP
MGLMGIFIISLGLAMDAFAVSICKGLSMTRMSWKKAAVIGTYFGGFQALMPIIGYLLGVGFQSKIAYMDHWISFGLLALIGINMIKESLEENESFDDKTDFRTMLILAIATSIDALTIGVTFAFLKVNIVSAAFIIGAITFAVSLTGVKIGNVFGDKYKKKAGIAGGIILILMGIKILVEHLNIINF